MVTGVQTCALPISQTVVPAIKNSDHPLDYLDVDESLVSQNFLIIKAGDGLTAYSCPDDNPATPASGRTWHHQPNA